MRRWLLGSHDSESRATMGRKLKAIHIVLQRPMPFSEEVHLVPHVSKLNVAEIAKIFGSARFLWKKPKFLANSATSNPLTLRLSVGQFSPAKTEILGEFRYVEIFILAAFGINPAMRSRSAATWRWTRCVWSDWGCRIRSGLITQLVTQASL